MTKGYRIKDVAERSGFTTATLRYYNGIGLLAGARQQIVELMTLTCELQRAATTLELHRPDGALRRWMRQCHQH